MLWKYWIFLLAFPLAFVVGEEHCSGKEGTRCEDSTEEEETIRNPSYKSKYAPAAKAQSEKIRGFHRKNTEKVVNRGSKEGIYPTEKPATTESVETTTEVPQTTSSPTTTTTPSPANAPEPPKEKVVVEDSPKERWTGVPTETDDRKKEKEMITKTTSNKREPAFTFRSYYQQINEYLSNHWLLVFAEEHWKIAIPFFFVTCMLMGLLLGVLFVWLLALLGYFDNDENEIAETDAKDNMQQTEEEELIEEEDEDLADESDC